MVYKNTNNYGIAKSTLKLWSGSDDVFDNLDVFKFPTWKLKQSIFIPLRRYLKFDTSTLP